MDNRNQNLNNENLPATPEPIATPATHFTGSSQNMSEASAATGAGAGQIMTDNTQPEIAEAAVTPSTPVFHDHSSAAAAPEIDPIYQDVSAGSYSQSDQEYTANPQPTQPAQTPQSGSAMGYGQYQASYQEKPSGSPYFSAQPAPAPAGSNPSYQEVKEKRRKRGKGMRFIAACLALALALYGSYSFGSSQAEQRIDAKLTEFQQELKNIQTTQTTAVYQPLPSSQPAETTIAEGTTKEAAVSPAPATSVSPVVAIAERVVPSVVTITSTLAPSRSSGLFSGGQASGSGILYKTEGDNLYLITNHHVIENASLIRVTFSNGESADAEVVGYDSRNDLAVLKVNLSDLNDKNLTMAVFGDSSALKVGQLAVAIGNPLGEGHDHTITAGVISSVNRTLDIGNIKNLEVIQTDAAINPGNSGGALVNERAEVIGINTAKYSDVKVEGMGFAIPSNIAMSVVEKILKNGSGDAAYAMSDERPFLGIGYSPINSDIYAKTGVPFGVYVTKVYEGSAAHAAGVKAGDILFSLNGVRIKDANMLFDNIGKLELGQEVKLGLVRGEEIFEVEAVITSFGEVNAKNNGELGNKSQENRSENQNTDQDK